MLRNFGRLFFLTMILSVSACAVMQPKADDELIIELAEKRQAALLKHDFKTAYQYMSPGYRQLNSLEQFADNYAGVYSWVSSDVLDASCEEDICKVNVEVVVDLGLMQNTRTPASEKVLIPRVNQETWLNLDNKWWFSKSQ